MTDRKINKIAISITFILFLVQIALVVLRITDTIKISWWLVLIPLWLYLLSWIVSLFIED